MSESNDEQFVPRSDEELARLLEAQLAQMRGQTGEQHRLVVPAEDESLDELFGALLEDTTNPIDIPAPAAVVDAPPQAPAFLEPDVTQPITFVAESIEETIAVEETITVEDVVVDGALIGEVVIDEVIVATTISETATSTPVPSMFGEADYIAAVLDEPAPAVEPVVSVVSETVVETFVVEAPSVSVNETNPIISFEPRPSFDELVFGVRSDD